MPFTAFWNTGGRDRLGGGSSGLSLSQRSSCPSENVELAVECISLEFRSESRIGGLILESPAGR